MKHLPAVPSCLLIAALLLLVGVASAFLTSPVANFSADNTYGDLTQPVLFTDRSAYSPTGWTWYFGDENYTSAWTLVNASPFTAGREMTPVVVLLDGSIVELGGHNGGGTNWNDTWRSSDDGTTWALVNASCAWMPRMGHTGVVLPDGSIVMMGGMDLVSMAATNETWRSIDKGDTWTLMNGSSGWAGRYMHTSVALPDGSIVIMGGRDKASNRLGDVWRSTDNGAHWVQMTANAGWGPRAYHTSVVLANGSILVMGGLDQIGQILHDVYLSADNGAAWTLVNANPEWPGRYGHTSAAIPDGSILVMGGSDGTFRNDVWRSTDNGTSWTQLPDAAWPARYYHSSAVLPDGCILVTGGAGTGGTSLNDVWTFSPAGSAEQNPAHTYAAPGSYTVTLMARNAQGSDSERKVNYVTLAKPFAPVPVISSVSPASGNRNMSVAFAITGSSFISGATLVEFRNQSSGVINATITNVSATRIDGTLDIPANASTGSWNVRVMLVNGGEAVKTNALTIQNLSKPTIVSITPVMPWYRNTTVKYSITGTNFEPGQTTVMFWNKSGTLLNATSIGITSVTTTKINGTFLVPVDASAVTAYNITITTVDGGTGGRDAAITVAASLKPTVVSVSPAVPWYRNSTVTYTITGTNFEPGKTVLTIWNKTGVMLNATSAGVTNVTALRINGTIVIPYDASIVGPYNITVTTVDGGTGGKDAAITIANLPKPAIDTVTPAMPWYRNATVNYALKGRYFRPGQTTVTFWNKTGVLLNATSIGITSINSTYIIGTFLVPEDASAVTPYNITVTTVDGGTGGRDAAITIAADPKPSIDTVTPAMPWVRNTTITYAIRGKNFRPGQTTVTFWNKTGVLLNATSIGITSITSTYINGTFLVPVDASTVTPYNITVTTVDGGTGGRDAAITIAGLPKPTVVSVTSVTPWYRNTSVSYTITGTNFQPGKTVVRFWNKTGTFLNSTSSGVTGVTATKITGTVIIPPTASIVTPYNITVTTVDGGTGGRDAAITLLAFPKATITKVEPLTPWARNTSIRFVITGTNFEPGTMNVTFSYPGNLTPLNATHGFTITSVNATMITGRVFVPGNASSGSWNVSVRTADGGRVWKTAAFTVPVPRKPTIVSITPVSPWYRNTTVNYIITGTNFEPGRMVMKIWNRTGTYLNASTSGLKNSTTTKIYGTLIIPYDASIVTPYNITIMTLDGGTGGKDAAITVNRFPAPTITALAPATGSPNTSVAFTLTGKNFQPGMTTVVLSHPAYGELDTTLYSVTSTQVIGRVNVPGDATIGPWKLNVTTVDGGLTSRPSALNLIRLPQPVISTFAPSTGYRGTNVSFVVTGKNFQNGGRTTLNLSMTGQNDIRITPVSVYSSRFYGFAEIPEGTTTGQWKANLTTLDGKSFTMPNAIRVL